jgi:hypothetical protein
MELLGIKMYVRATVTKTLPFHRLETYRHAVCGTSCLDVRRLWDPRNAVVMPARPGT